MKQDQMLSLMRAGLKGDTKHFDLIVRQVWANEKRAGKAILANRIEAVLNRGRPQGVLCPLKETGGVLVEQEPRATLASLTLDTHIKKAVTELSEEHEHVGRLRENGLEPRNRVLLTGPPGNGKTSLAEAIAGALKIPFYAVSYAALIGQYLGETPARLQKAFDFVQDKPCVLFFDEFDTVGKERGGNDVGEMHRVVSILLLQIDRMPSNVVCVVATNHAEMLDRAVWRRFQISLEMRPPTPEQIEKLLDGIICNHRDFGSFSDVVMYADHYRRRLVLTENVDTAAREAQEWWNARERAGLRN